MIDDNTEYGIVCSLIEQNLKSKKPSMKKLMNEFNPLNTESKEFEFRE